MAENHRRRFRNKKRDDARQQQQQEMLGAPVTIARRDDPRIGLVQPRILLKKDQHQQQQQQQQVEREAKASASSGNGGNQDAHSSLRTIIINRSQDARNSSERCPSSSTPSNSSVCAALVSSGSGSGSASSSALSLGKDKGNANGQDTAPLRMTRPTPLTVANGVFNANARKLFHKTNTDFTVIGVLGAQGVGKSSLLNLLSSDYGMDYDYHQHLFSPDADNCTFLTRHKNKAHTHKNILRPRTENLQFFITKERFILLDTPPLMSAGSSSNSGPKESDYHDLQSLATICHLLNVCHILIIAVDEMNLEHFHLINAALRLRPQTLGKGLVKDYLPHVLFVRTRAQRQHFEQTTRERVDQQLIQLYAKTGLHIYRGRGEARCLNSLVMPEINGNGATVFHPSLGEVVRQFRERVLGTTRSSAMCQGNDLSETLWFEMLAESFRKGTQHFEKVYAEIKIRHLDGWKQRRNDSWRNFGCGDC